MKDVLIITGTPAGNKAAEDLLLSVGITWVDKEPISPGMLYKTTHRTMRAEGVSQISTENLTYIAAELRDNSMEIMHYSQLTPELVATFPGAKQLPPAGPFHYEGRDYVVDGDEKRLPKAKDILVDSQSGKVYAADWDWNSVKAWILKPVITADLQAAMDQLDKCTDAIKTAEIALEHAYDSLCALKDK